MKLLLRAVKSAYYTQPLWNRHLTPSESQFTIVCAIQKCGLQHTTSLQLSTLRGHQLAKAQSHNVVGNYTTGQSLQPRYYSEEGKQSLTKAKHLNHFQRKALREQLKREKVRASQNRKSMPILETSRNISVKEIAKLTDRTVDQVLHAAFLVDKKITLHPNTVVKDAKLLTSTLGRLGYRWRAKKQLKEAESVDIEQLLPSYEPDAKRLASRPPVVVMLGHVDHGKTSLLDYLRQSSVASREAGGITQKIGAFSFTMPTGETVTFVDAPGHAAFSAMRRRGAQLTDIVVLVVAADDGVMEQTIESIKMAQDAGVSVVVAINKCDVKRANPKAAMRKLAEYDIIPEQLGGDTQTVQVSAKTGKGVDKLVESIVLEAELLELTADTKCKVQAIVVESRVDKHVGPVASCIINQGSLKPGQWLIADTALCKVRSIFNEDGKKLKTAPPSSPVDITGWKSLPSVGQTILQVDSQAQAKKVIAARSQLKQEEDLKDEKTKVEQIQKEHRRVYQSLREQGLRKRERVYRLIAEVKGTVEKQTEIPEFNIIVKADVDGSLEALHMVLDTYDCHDEVILSVVTADVGNVTVKDLDLAETTGGIIYTFNLDVPHDIKLQADERGVNIYSFDVIYHLIHAMKDKMAKLLPPAKEYTFEGEGEVLQTFNISIKGGSLQALGCNVNDGSFYSDSIYQLIRDDEVIHEGPVSSLKIKQVDVDTVKSGTDCGLVFQDGNVVPKVGDIVRSCEVKTVPPKVNWNPDGF